MAVTSKRNNMRLLAIVLGEEVSKVRNQETVDLLDYGFNLYEVKTLRNKGDFIDKLNISKANNKDIDIIVKDDITILKRKDEQEKDYKEEVIINELNLPLKKDSIIGKIRVKDNDNIIGEYDLIVNQDVSKKSLLKIFFDNLKDIISGNINF